MYHLLRVQKEWPGRDVHRQALVEVRRTRMAEADAQRRGEVRKQGVCGLLYTSSTLTP